MLLAYLPFETKSVSVLVQYCWSGIRQLDIAIIVSKEKYVWT
jgi:hypothetical protein